MTVQQANLSIVILDFAFRGQMQLVGAEIRVAEVRSSQL